MDEIYQRFYTRVETMVTAKDIRSFKSHPDITYMFEHVGYEFGQKYLSLLRTHSTLTDEQIVAYCTQNDSVGGGEKHSYGEWTTSPSNFRYLYHAHLILTHLRSVHSAIGSEEWVDQPIVEVGCGYGGLCLAICMLSASYRVRIPDYHLVDLPAISDLQALYLDQTSSFLNRSTAFHHHSAFEYGADLPESATGLFWISNYCFSEISEVNQQKYLQHLLVRPKVSHGFMTWNHIPLYSFGYEIRSEEEEPLTGHGNRYVYF